jgi:4-hydroxybenzoate polyprenyltransferase
VNISGIIHTGVIFIALSASSMALFFSILFQEIPSLTYFLLVFLLTYAVYSIDRLAGMKEDELSHSERTLFLRRNKWPFAASIALAFSGALLLATRAGWVAVLIPIAPIVVIFYSGNLSQEVLGIRKPNLKRYFIIKNIIVASGWAFLLFTTSFYLGNPITIGQWLFFPPLMMKLFVMTVAYDFKDINSDKKAGVQTLPIVIGEDFTKIVLHILNIAATAVILLLVYSGLLPLFSVVFIPAFIYQFFMINLVRKDAPEWVYFIICDLEQFFWLVFLGIGRWVIDSP